MERIYRWLLKQCIHKLYSTDEARNEFKRQVNNETWLSSQIGTGGHSLSTSKPICNEEVVSIMCTLCENRTYVGDDDKTTPINYYESSWKS